MDAVAFHPVDLFPIFASGGRGRAPAISVEGHDSSCDVFSLRILTNSSLPEIALVFHGADVLSTGMVVRQKQSCRCHF